MPPDSLSVVRFRIDPEARLALVRFEGTVTGSDILDAARALHSDPAWSDGFDVIWDCSRVVRHAVGPEDVAPLIVEEVPTGSGMDALVQNMKPSDSLISNMIASFLRLRGKPAAVFSSVEEALEAVGCAALPTTLQGV